MSKAKKPAAKKKAAAVTMYLVVRDAFDASNYEGLSYGRPSDDDGDRSDVPVRAFATKAAAEAFARELDDEIRRTFPPPLFAGEDQDEDNAGPRVAATVAALGLPTFSWGEYNYESGRRFVRWWAEHVADMSTEQRAVLWEPFAGLSFHRVKQIEVEG